MGRKCTPSLIFLFLESQAENFVLGLSKVYTKFSFPFQPLKFLMRRFYWIFSKLFAKRGIFLYNVTNFQSIFHLFVLPKLLLGETMCKQRQIFPPKDLEKIQALKIRMRQLFLKKLKATICNIKDFNFHYSIILVNRNKDTNGE